MKAARLPPRSEPAKSQDFRPKAIPRSARSAALFVRQTRAPLDEEREGGPPVLLEHVGDRLGDGVVLRHGSLFGPHPVVQILDHGADQPVPGVEPTGDVQAVDLALDVEDRRRSSSRLPVRQAICRVRASSGGHSP